MLTFCGFQRLCVEGFVDDRVEKWAFARYRDERFLVVYFSTAVPKEVPVKLFGPPNRIKNVNGCLQPSCQYVTEGLITEIISGFHDHTKFEFN